ncbi:MAG: polysaccharide deacetylase family protein [bacterium]|nr:polysaccharide deacetylase family protein [bacterium]
MRHVNVSFDDGYQHLCEFLPPLMERLSFRPTIFVPTDLIGRPNSWDYSCRLAPDPHMDETSIRELADLGVRFGSHGKSHCDLTSCDPERIKSELADSRKRLQNLIGRPVDEISYPFGRTNPRVLEAAAEAGFSRGYTMDFPTPEDLPLSIGRIAVYGFDTHLTVYHKLTGGRLYRLERFKAHITNRLSGGTVLLNKLRGHQ